MNLARLIRSLVCGGTLLVASVAAAQSFPDAPRVSLSGSYSFVRTSLASPSGENESALSTSVAVRINKRISGRFDYLKINRPNAQVFLFGPEYRYNAGELLPSSDYFKPAKFDLFVHALAGAVRSGNGDNDFAFAAGGGVDFTETGTKGVVRVRVAQVEFLRAPIFDGGLTLRNHAKISSGVVIAVDKLFQ